MTVRIVVPSERHVGQMSETRASLMRRLFAELVPDVRPATEEETRAALADGLARAAETDRRVAALVALGPRAWESTLDAVEEALGFVATNAIAPEVMARIANEATIAGDRAGVLIAARRAVDATLARAGLVDPATQGQLLARAIETARPAHVADVVGAREVVARAVTAWDASDVVWWRALERALTRLGGGAKIELPMFDVPLDASREKDPFEVIADDLTRALDEPPSFAAIDAPLGCMRIAEEVDRSRAERVDVRNASDVDAQARAACDAVVAALREGIAVERIAIALPREDEATAASIRRVLEDAGVIAFEPRTRAPAKTGIVAVALRALTLGRDGLPRREVAALLRSAYVDARSLADVDDAREAMRLLRDLARALDDTPAARADDPVTSLAKTARAWRDRAVGDEAETRAELRTRLARRIGDILLAPTHGKTRREHVASARALAAAMGFERRSLFGQKNELARDGAIRGLARAELLARSRDARAWELFLAALEAYESASARLGIADAVVSHDAFVHAIRRALETGSPSPSAARAFAVRIVPWSELAGEELSLLVVVDANDGVIPRAPMRSAFITPALEARLTELAPTTSVTSRRARDLAALALAASRATRIVLVHRATDAEGTKLAPAPLVLSLVRAGARESAWGISPLTMRPLSTHDARLTAIARDVANAAKIDPEATRRARIERTREAYFEDAKRSANEATGFVALRPVERVAVADETGGARPLAVTALEAIATCAFQGFARRVLGAREKLTTSDLPDAREQGTLLHEALAAAFRASIDLFAAKPRDRAEILARAMTAADACLARESASSELRRAAIERLRDDVRAVVNWSIDDEAWSFLHAEQSFGDDSDSSWPPFVIEKDGVRLALQGKIDRVDASAGASGARGAIRVIDYKRSKNTAILGATALQVPLYALVAARALEAAASEGLYLTVSRREIARGVKVDKTQDAWRALFVEQDGLTTIEGRALSLVRDLRNGALAPNPVDEGACARCGYDGVCRKPRFTIARDDGD